MRALVTGAMGFVGRHLVNRLERDGWEVRATDVDHLDVTNEGLLMATVRGVDVVFHLAGIVGVDKVLEVGAEKVVDVNLVGTLNVLRAARRYGCRVVFTSTSEAAGCGENMPYGEDEYRVYGPTSTARWVYAETKALGEHLCLDFAAKGTPATAVRLFNAYGPGLEGRVLTRFARQLLQGNPVTLVDGGEQTRCFTWIDDVVEGIVRCATHPSAVNGEVLNLGSAEETSMKELALALVDVLEIHSFQLEDIAGQEVFGDGYADIRHRVPDVRKARELLGWEATTPLADGLKLMAPWLLEACS